LPWRLAAVDCHPVGHNKTDKRGSIDTDQYPKVESLLPKPRATLSGGGVAADDQEGRGRFCVILSRE